MQNIEGLVNAEAHKIHFVEPAGEKSEVLENAAQSHQQIEAPVSAFWESIKMCVFMFVGPDKWREHPASSRTMGACKMQSWQALDMRRVA